MAASRTEARPQGRVVRSDGHESRLVRLYGTFEGARGGGGDGAGSVELVSKGDGKARIAQQGVRGERSRQG